MKKIISLIVAFVMMFTFSSVAFAGEVQTNDENEIVATVSVCSCIYVWPISGHTWIYVENLSDEPVQVGLYEVPVGQGVSVGSFSFSVSDGWGLYYNLEAYRENRDDNAENHWSISKELTAGELENLSNELLNYPNYWSFAANCATFAFSMWNSAADGHFFSLLIPAISQFEIIVGGGEKGVMEMYYPTADQVYKQRGTGSDAYLEPVSAKTLSD